MLQTSSCIFQEFISHANFSLHRLRFQSYCANIKNTTAYMLVITPDNAQSIAVEICSAIVTECDVIQTEALMYWCEKFYAFQEVA